MGVFQARKRIRKKKGKSIGKGTRKLARKAVDQRTPRNAFRIYKEKQQSVSRLEENKLRRQIILPNQSLEEKTGVQKRFHWKTLDTTKKDRRGLEMCSSNHILMMKTERIPLKNPARTTNVILIITLLVSLSNYKIQRKMKRVAK